MASPLKPMTSSAGGGSRLRVLCLHSFRTSSSILKKQMDFSGFAADVADLVDFDYVDAPHTVPNDKVDARLLDLFGDDEPYREWWNANPAPDGSGDQVYEGLYDAMKTVRDRTTQFGPYDGILGFSQGGCLAELMCRSAWAADGSCAFRFAVIMCSFACRDASFKSIYPEATFDANEVQNSDVPLSVNHTPTLLLAGGRDRGVPPELTGRLAKALQNSTMITIPENNHAVPRLRTEQQKESVRKFFEDRLSEKSASTALAGAAGRM